MCSCIHKGEYTHKCCRHVRTRVLYKCAHMPGHMCTQTHTTSLQRPSSFLKMFFPPLLQIQYWRMVEEAEEGWRYRSQRKEESRETHSSLRGQRRKGYILRKWPNEEGYSSWASHYCMVPHFWTEVLFFFFFFLCEWFKVFLCCCHDWLQLRLEEQPRGIRGTLGGLRLLRLIGTSLN